MHISQLAEYLGWIVAIVGALGTLWVVLKKFRRKAVVVADKANAVTDVLLGRPAILHPETGEVLVPETPGIGTRMATIEKWQSEAGPILKQLADTQAQMVRAHTRIDKVEERLEDHINAGHRHAS